LARAIESPKLQFSDFLMRTHSEELFTLAGRLESVAERGAISAVKEPLGRLKDAAEQVGKSWSGSWLGYQSRVYYADFQPPPGGANFSLEWGIIPTYSNQGTEGVWEEHAFDNVRQVIEANAESPDLSRATELATEAQTEFDVVRSECLSIISTVLAADEDHFLTRLKDEIEGIQAFTAAKFIEHMRPKGGFISRDSLATSQGFHTPPHIAVLAKVFGLEQPTNSCGKLAKLIRQTASHLSRQERNVRTKGSGTKIFIGHGRSLVWKNLKDFLSDRLGLPWDEFNRVPIAGVTNIARLSEMLDSTVLAFLVMTAEDEQNDGKMNARMNVIHEAGLFQGRLGFSRAIVLLEQGCQEFSNISGLGQIRFPAGKIESAFEEIRQVLEREGILEA
jgi:predicted nucleotide-binding protein